MRGCVPMWQAGGARGCALRVILTTSRAISTLWRVSARFHPLHLSAARAAEEARALRWRSSRPSCSGSRRSSSQPSRSAARSSSRTTRGSLRRSRRTRRTCSTRRARAAPGGEAGGRGGEGVTCMRPCLRATSALAFSSQEPFARVPTLPAQARASWAPEGHGCSDGPFASPARAAHACTLIICARFCSQEEPEEKENTANGDVAAERDVVPRRLGLSARDDSTRGAPGRPPSAHPVRPLPTQPALGRACPRLAATTRFRALTSPACFPCADEAGSKRASEGDAPIGETKRVKRD